MHLYDIRILTVLAFGVFAGPAAAGPEGTDMKLEDMGFTMRAANTPEQLARLRLLPPRKFVTRTKGDRRYFLYADPDYCKCIFLGDEAAMQNYKASILPPPALAVAPGYAPSFAQQDMEALDPDVAGSIPDGDILDY